MSLLAQTGLTLHPSKHGQGPGNEDWEQEVKPRSNALGSSVSGLSYRTWQERGMRVQGSSRKNLLSEKRKRHRETDFFPEHSCLASAVVKLLLPVLC